MANLKTLVDSPRQEFHVFALVGAEHTSGDAGPILDARARAEYQARLESLRDQISEAESFGDLERARRGRAEIEALATQLASAIGLSGRDRRAASDVERARVNVQRRLKSAIDAIGEFDAELARYLRAVVTTGVYCSFNPV